MDQAHAIISEIRQLQNSLSNGEHERQTLLQVIQPHSLVEQCSEPQYKVFGSLKEAPEELF